MVRLIDLYRIVGRRLTRKLIEAKWIVPIQSGNERMSAFDSEQVHRALGWLTREGHTLLPRSPFPPTGAEERRRNPRSLEEIVLDDEELARLSE
jgi:hypothetical protein